MIQQDTISGFKKILAGQYVTDLLLKTIFIIGEFDHLPEVAFYMVGPIEEVISKAEELAQEQFHTNVQNTSQKLDYQDIIYVLYASITTINTSDEQLMMTLMKIFIALL